MDKKEIAHLNAMGVVKVMGWKIYSYGEYLEKGTGWHMNQDNYPFIVSIKGALLLRTEHGKGGSYFNPYHDLNHTKMVKDAMVEKGYGFSIHIRPDNLITCPSGIVVKCYHVTKQVSVTAEAPLDQEGMAVMRAIEMALNPGKVFKFNEGENQADTPQG